MTDAIDERASVRTFTEEALTQDEIVSLLKAAMAAPSAGNQQPWEFVVARDAELRQALAETSAYAKAAGIAPVTFVLLMRERQAKHPGMAPQDLSAAAENLLLRATSLGLGAVWLGVYPDPERMGVVSRALGLSEDDAIPFALIAVGHPDKPVVPKGPSHYDESRVSWR